MLHEQGRRPASGFEMCYAHATLMWLALHPCRPVPPQLWAGGQTGGLDTHSVKVYDA